MVVKIVLESLVKDAVRFCNDGFAGLLLVGGEDSAARLLEDGFKIKTEGKYPVIRRTVKEHADADGNRTFEGKPYYVVDLSQIEVVNTPYQSA